jgi:protein involved in sex pheromone biosynthesis
VNIESVMPSEQVSHLPTSINEDDTNIVGNDGFPQFQNKVEGNLNKFNGIIGRSKLRTPSMTPVDSRE